ncbi:MAG: hypothetical protein ABSF26_30905 [Thermoguttaceae bacterium]
MQVKVYVPKTVEIPSEYLLAIAKRATDSVGENAATVSATRGNLIRQAVHDGLIRDLDSLVGEDGVVDVVCDPGAELPLEVNGEPFSLTQLVDVLARRTSYSNAEQTARAA